MRRILAIVLTLIFSFLDVSWANAPLSQQGMPAERRRPSIILKNTDADVAARARRLLERDDNLSYEARNVNIRVRNGRAILQGTVSSPEEYHALKKKMMAVEGVRAVDNKVTISE